jgi:hypothetical protein
VLCVAVVTGVLLGWRTRLPSNRHRELDVLVKTTASTAHDLKVIANTYDECVTQVTARNFARDGFLRTHFLANRGGYPLASFLDGSKTQCDNPSPTKNVVRYDFGNGIGIDMTSLNNDCVYAHFPPLADWLFGLVAMAGLDQYGHYRVLAVMLNTASLVVLYFWLRREVSEWASFVAIALAATLPAYIHWADALFFHPFQFLFLFGGLLSLSTYLTRRIRSHFVVAWLLFAGQSLLSYHLLPCTGVMMSVLVMLESGLTRRLRIKLLLALFSAPTLATLLHFGLRLSHMGVRHTLSNVVVTLHSRSLGGISHLGFVRLLMRFREHLIRFDLIVLSMLLVIAIRLYRRAPLKRPLWLLFGLFAGGVGFWVAFPGTNLAHHWITYRHLMPFVIVLLAEVAESIRLALVPSPGNEPSHVAHCTGLERIRDGIRAVFAAPRRNLVHYWGVPRACACFSACLALTCLVPLGWTASRNVTDIRKGLELMRDRAPSVAPNLATHYLDLVQWSSDGSKNRNGHLYLLFDGRRLDALSNPNLAYRLPTGITSHDEIWWLEPIVIRSVALLTETTAVDMLNRQCWLSAFNGVAFDTITHRDSVSVEPFVPNANESAAPSYRWLRYALEAPLEARGIRLSCSRLNAPVPIHEMEIH